MPSFLRKIPFTDELLPAVQGFFCGNEDWERPLAEWITAGPQVKNGALYELKKRKGKLQVWLHVNEHNDLVGYSSLGESNWPWQGERITVRLNYSRLLDFVKAPHITFSVT
ncbi:hypothetical protein AYO44_12615 [Planctomycetaceae bacterium SCGC AG-212-F19]|nr:hypothetical protein AYO44_12615 [Planctomycetaceae bacterium SCGC AG-212-F19]